MHHPRNKAERRRINKRKSFDRFKLDRARDVEFRAAQEALETKEALNELRIQIPSKEEEG